MQEIEPLMGILQCPNCRSLALALRPVETPIHINGIPLSDREIYCGGCDERYPISVEGIPILWTPEIQSYLGYGKSIAPETLAANMEVYDEISDHYLEYVRTTDQARNRLLACVQALDADIMRSFPDGGWHIDFGCGPGHVLIWTGDWAASRGIQQVGLDVSIQNLRNVAARTNAFAVLGDAVRMPFRSGIATLVTEASVLHHIKDWRGAVAETCRVSHPDGVMVYDNEPTRESLDWSPLARVVFEMRFVAYKILSYFMKSRRNFRNMKLAKFNYYTAEVHNQPGLGFDTDEVEQAFQQGGRQAKLYYRAGDTLLTGSGKNSFQQNILLLLSTRDWRNPKRGLMTLVAS